MIVGVGVTNSGSDMGQADPMRAEIERRTGGQPKELLLDGGFAKLDSIDEASKAGTTVYAPVPKQGDSPAVADWRQRMGTAEAKEIYKQRAATAETVNADLRTWRGLDRFLVWGSGKVLSVILWSASTYNVAPLPAGRRRGRLLHGR